MMIRLNIQHDKLSSSHDQILESVTKLKVELAEYKSKLASQVTQCRTLEDRLDISEQELSIKSVAT